MRHKLIQANPTHRKERHLNTLQDQNKQRRSNNTRAKESKHSLAPHSRKTLVINSEMSKTITVWHNRAVLDILNRIDQLERELNIEISPIPQAPTRCRCEI